MTLICDGGVRTGTDALKLLKLGADFIGVGRPIVYGLLYDKQKGVSQVLDLLYDELKTASILYGIKSYRDLKNSILKVNF